MDLSASLHSASEAPDDLLGPLTHAVNVLMYIGLLQNMYQNIGVDYSSFAGGITYMWLARKKVYDCQNLSQVHLSS